MKRPDGTYSRKDAKGGNTKNTKITKPANEPDSSNGRRP